jgi:hypothetical protein
MTAGFPSKNHQPARCEQAGDARGDPLCKVLLWDGVKNIQVIIFARVCLEAIHSRLKIREDNGSGRRGVVCRKDHCGRKPPNFQ